MPGNTGPARHTRAGFLEGEAIETPPPIGRESQDPTVTQAEMPSFRAAVTIQVQLLIRQQVRHKQPTSNWQ